MASSTCLECGAPVVQESYRKRLYCSMKCRLAYYARRNARTLTCSFCGGEFTGNRPQVVRVKRGKKVCCSADCRNRMNIAACLAAQARRVPTQEPGT